MDVIHNYTEYLFSLPVALTFPNSSNLDEFALNSTLSVNPRGTNDSWKKNEVETNEPQRTEKIGDTLRKELKWAFILHTYGFGCLFFILAFYTFFSILNIRSFISSRPFMSTINGFLCLLGVSRATSLFIDPYNLKENMPKLIGEVLWDVGFPSIISAFCLVQLAFLQLTQLQVGAEGLRRKSCLSLVVTAHFLFTIGMDIVVASHENLTIVKRVIQYIFLTWGVFLCSNFLYSGYKVMSIIRSIPGGLKPRDLPDSSYKGIMQLAILAPHSNLAGSMTAALLPTLCTPKIHQQDNISLSTVGFRSEGNSRILESESIPMLEEMTGSSGDEISPKPLARGPSFQNQTRNSQKLKLKPKLSLKSIPSNKSKEELEEEKFPGLKSTTPKNLSPRFAHGKPTEFDFNVRLCNGVIKHTQNFVPSKTNYEFKSKIQCKTSFENENFHFKNGRKGNLEESLNKSDTTNDTLIPDILVSCPSGPGNDKEEANEKKQENLNKIMNEITNDLNEMRIVREGKSMEPEMAEVHKLNKGKSEFISEISMGNRRKLKSSLNNSREENFYERKGSVISDVEIRRSSSRIDNLMSEAGLNQQENLSSAINGLEEMPVILEKVNRRKAAKSLSWKKKEMNEDEEIATHECLLPQENPTDLTLRSVFNHIEYINRGAQSNVRNEDDLEKVHKSKVEWVLNITYITAMWGLMLCLSNMGRIYSPFEVPESREAPFFNSTHFRDVGTTEEKENGILYSSWPWLWFQTFCRALELAMGCAMANITRQPTANHRYARTLSLRHRDTFYTM